MRIGVPRERRARDYRVGMIPAGVSELVECGHTGLTTRAGRLFSAEVAAVGSSPAVPAAGFPAVLAAACATG